MKWNLLKTLRHPLQILNILGSFSSETQNANVYLVHTIFIFLFFELPIASLPTMRLFVTEDVDVIKVINLIFVHIQIAVVPFKTIFLAYNSKKLNNVLKFLDNRFFVNCIQEQKGIVENGLRTLTIVHHYITMCFFAVIALVLPPLADISKRDFPVGMWFPWDCQTDLLQYSVVYLYTFSGT